MDCRQEGVMELAQSGEMSRLALIGVLNTGR